MQDVFGNTVAAATEAVTVSLGANPSAGTLSGMLTVAATQGISTFSNLRIDRPGGGYTLAVSAPGLSGAMSAPFSVTLTFAAVSAGTFNTCGLTTSGATYCWGYNAFGQLGDGSTYNRSSPVLVSGGLTLAAVSAGGGHHGCGVTIPGAAYCWGYNAFGQLGLGDTIHRTSPVAVLGGHSFATVSAWGGFAGYGLGHTCGVTTGGAAYCWGDNSKGQLGDGDTTSQTIPVSVLGGRTFAAVSAGYAHTCGLTTGSAAYCWGDDNEGQLGDGADTTLRSSPVPVSGGLTFATVSVGGGLHTCGVAAAGAAYCWGDNSFGQLGDGSTNNSSKPVLSAGGLTFAEISAGLSHTCGVTTGGAAYCWGYNLDGELGDGSTSSRSSFVEVSAGSLHTCGVTTAGVAYCWGSNAFGQLGDGTTSNSLVPVRVVQ